MLKLSNVVQMQLPHNFSNAMKLVLLNCLCIISVHNVLNISNRYINLSSYVHCDNNVIKIKCYSLKDHPNFLIDYLFNESEMFIKEIIMMLYIGTYKNGYWWTTCSIYIKNS